MDPATLIAVAKDTKAIANFVLGDGLKDTISMIVGDIHLEAAKLALETAIISKNKRDRINSVITHLEAAHISYSNNLSEYDRKDESFYGRIKENVGLRNVTIVLNYSNILLIEQKNVWVCCLIALCYASLGDHQAAINILSLAKKDCGDGRWGGRRWHHGFSDQTVEIATDIGAAMRGQKFDYSIRPLAVLTEFQSILEKTMKPTVNWSLMSANGGVKHEK